jgi:hypothetical protein
MITFLEASGRAADIPESHDLYGWLIGDWELDVLHYAGADLGAQSRKGEAHFAWVLDGRAVQDVWSWRPQMHGTTLRIWDPAIQAWRVTWFNPVSGARVDLTGRRNGKDIVQIGAYANGTPIRWIFSEITGDSFRWTGESLTADGTTWKLEGEFRAHRTKTT